MYCPAFRVCNVLWQQILDKVVVFVPVSVPDKPPHVVI